MEFESIITHKEYIDAVNLCKRYLFQQLKFNESQFKFTKSLEIHSVRDEWMKMTPPFKIKVIYQKRKGILFRVGDVLTVTGVTKTIWLENNEEIGGERLVKENELNRFSVYRVSFKLLYTLISDEKERILNVYFNAEGEMRTSHQEFKILK